MGLLAAALTSVIWALQAIVLKVAVKTIPPMTVSWFRFAFASVALFLILLVSNRSSLSILKRPPLGTVVAGIFLAANYYLFLIGLDLTAPGNAQVMIQSAPYGFAIYAILFFGESVTPLSILGFLLTPIGFILFFNEQVTATASAAGYAAGNFWILFSAAAWIVYSIFQKTLSRVLLPSQILLIVYLTSTLIMLPLAQTSTILNWNATEWLIMITLGLFTLVAYGALGFALVRSPASQVSIIITANPILTIFTMQYLAFLGVNWIEPEVIQPLGYLGALLVVLGVVLAVSSKGKK